MTIKCGIAPEKLRDKKPYERFDEIRKFLMAALAKENKDALHLEMAAVKKVVDLPSPVFTQVRCGQRSDIEIFQKLAAIIGEDVTTLLEEIPASADPPKSEAPVKVEVKKEETTKTPREKLQYGFENHTDMHLSLVVKDGTIHVYVNESAPVEAKIVLLKCEYVRVGGKDIKKTFPETVKL